MGESTKESSRGREEESEDASHDGGYGLTLRELTVLRLLAEGKSDKEIAHELQISPLTVHKHVSNILAKMNAGSRTEASMRAFREGLVP